MEWKGKPEQQHIYWSIFRKEGPKELVQKFGDEYNPKSYGPFEHEGYSYAAVKKIGQSGKEYFDIERSPIGQAPAPSNGNGDRSAAIEKRDQRIQENFEARMKLDKEALDVAKEDLKAKLLLANQLAKTNELLEIITKNGMKGVTFQKASEGQQT